MRTNYCAPTREPPLSRRIVDPRKPIELSREPFMEPIERAQEALIQESDRLAIRQIGETAIIRRA